ncbi:MAG: acyloxyacyl hydrolase [Acidobacteria bacterium]|nr:acyloxyacyl hydrolase [Acidobacteriota bacterium]
MLSRLRFLICAAFVLCAAGPAAARQDAAAPGPAAPPPPALTDDGRAQYPPLLANSFVSVNVGYINYAFSERQLEPGYRAESVAVPHVAVRAVLFGHHFGKYLSAQASYMRPVRYVKYRNLEGSGTHSVWLHFGTVTLQARAPAGRRVSLYGEGGLGITNRSGFEVDGHPVVRDAHFSSLLVGGGLEYRVSPAVDVVAGGAFIPRHPQDREPETVFSSIGVRYTMRPLPASRVQETVAAGFAFPTHLIQVGYATNAFGYRTNNFFSRTVPVFWGGTVKVERSLVSVRYQRNVFHTKKRLAFDIGASAGTWRSLGGERFQTFSVYPLVRFVFFRPRAADLYMSYSVAGPSYISRRVIDDLNTGGHFTFQDFMGVGLFTGPHRHLNLEVGLNHYSNGNLIPDNAGVKIPLTFKVGYAF